ncbi:MAG: NAD(P)H-dependent oxidoreductase [Cyanothece sp. SIO2G6]|nr:NAD(P)H-dependent oxidoreductase [Cyanothece sp. SIO2G6]
MSEQSLEFISPDQLLAHLKWRYAVKKFDPDRKIAPDVWNALEQSLILSPSSFGMQPWKFFVVNNPEIRQQLLPFSFKQAQVIDASHLVVLALKLNTTEADVDYYISCTAELRQIPAEKLEGFGKVIKDFLGRMDADGLKIWAKMQCYIALGQLMTSAAHLGVDACPMEGFLPSKYDETLGLTEKGYSAAVLCPLGYRDPSDPYASYPKVRYSYEDMIEVI